MRLTICLTAAALVICAASTQADAKKAAKAAAFQLDKTSWTYTDKKEGKLKESIDADGNYITQTVGGKHVDHGTAVMKDKKACFTSAMSKEGEVCWTTSPVAVGHSMKTTSDKGEKLTVHRIAYVKLEMPK
jgi:predicted PilT family ATPase